VPNLLGTEAGRIGCANQGLPLRRDNCIARPDGSVEQGSDTGLSTDRKLHLGKNEWHETTLIYRRKEDSEHGDYRQYLVFMTNTSSAFLTEYGYRWEIESRYKSIKRFMAATTSKDFGLRFFYFAFACLL